MIGGEIPGISRNPSRAKKALSSGLELGIPLLVKKRRKCPPQLSLVSSYFPHLLVFKFLWLFLFLGPRIGRLSI